MRTVLVTGHSKGIGRSITEKLLERGDSVVGVSRTALNDQNALFQFTADLANTGVAADIGKKIIQSHNIDAVICNAGAGKFGALENFSAEQIEQQIQLNLVSPLVLLQSVMPALKRQNQSNIVLVGSESALHGGRFGSVYSAAKFGLRGAAQALRHECASANCRVGIINPGMTRTGFFDELSFEPGNSEQQALLASDVSEAVLTMLDSSRSAVIDEIVINPLHRVVQKKLKH